MNEDASFVNCTTGTPSDIITDENSLSFVIENTENVDDGDVACTTTAIERQQLHTLRKSNGKQRRSFGVATTSQLESIDPTIESNCNNVTTELPMISNDISSNTNQKSDSLWKDDIDDKDEDIDTDDNVDDTDYPNENKVSVFLTNEHQSGENDVDEEDYDHNYNNQSNKDSVVLPSDLLPVSSTPSGSKKVLPNTPQTSSTRTSSTATPISPEGNSNIASDNHNINEPSPIPSPPNTVNEERAYDLPAQGTHGNSNSTNTPINAGNHKDCKQSNTIEEMSIDDILYSTEVLFEQVQDKTTVTVKDIIQSLMAEYQVTQFNKTIKTAIRTRLIELMTASATTTPSDSSKGKGNKNDTSLEDRNEDEPGDESVEANVESDVGDSDQSDTDDDDDDEASEMKQGDDEEAVPSEDEGDDEEYMLRTSRKKKKKIMKNSTDDLKSSKSNKKQRKEKERKQRPKKPSTASTKLALRVHAEQLRKRRLEELRVRNEELLVHQNSIDKERAECIAAKFVTNTVELRQIRFEQRNQLLSKLNMKRINACSTLPTGTIATKTEMIKADDDSTICNKDSMETNNDIPIETEMLGDSDGDDSDDDDELEIVGHPSLANKAVPLSSTRLNTMPSRKVSSPKKSNSNNAMALLDLADANMLRKQKSNISPGRGMIDPRALLRHKLKEKQRFLGNRWLARELGYQTEAEHLEACLQEENSKRERIYQQEQQRIKDTERAIERMLQEVDDDGDNEDEDIGNDVEKLENVDGNYEDEHAQLSLNGDDDDEDEEMIMARELADDKQTFEDESNDEISEELVEVEVPAVVNDEKYGVLSEPEESNMVSEQIIDSSDSTASLKKCAIESPVNDGQGHVSRSISSTIAESDDASNNIEDEKIPVTTGTSKSETFPSDEASEVTNESKTDTKDGEIESTTKPKGPRNSAWQAILKRDAEKAKKKKRSQLVEEEADEEEEEEVAGLEDFGFVVHKKKAGDDDEDEADLGEYDEDDLKHVVDDLSDDEGDEAAGEKARKAMEAKEEKERHKEMLRRMRDGYDGRRGGIAGGGGGARGFHRFDQLVAADNREDAKQLGLLNDDELDSDNEEGEEILKNAADNEEDDEHILLDKMLKARFLHRSTVEEEQFSDDEHKDDNEEDDGDEGTLNKIDEEELEQERLAKRFAKRARMQRLIETHGHEAEFSQSKLIDEDATMKLDLQRMKNGLLRSQSDSVSNGWQANNISNLSHGYTNNKPKGSTSSSSASFASSILSKGGSLAIALQANRKKERTTFVSSSGKNGIDSSMISSTSSAYQKCIAFNHVGFHHASSKLGKSRNDQGSANNINGGGMSFTRKVPSSNQDSLFSKIGTMNGNNAKKRKF